MTAEDLQDMCTGTSYSKTNFIEEFKAAFHLLPADSGKALKYTLAELSAGRYRFHWSIYLPKDGVTVSINGILPLSTL